MKIALADIGSLLPPLSNAEREALTASIKTEGIRDPILVDENGVILDGHNRYAIDNNAPRKVIPGLTDGEKLAYAYRVNYGRRNLSPEQKYTLQPTLKALAVLLSEDHTQEEIGPLLLVDQGTISRWLTKKPKGHIMQAHNVSTPDSRVKIPVKQHPTVAKRVTASESVAQIAADYGVSEKTVRRIATKEQKQMEAKQRREALVKALPADAPTVQVGDFRQLGKAIPDAYVDLILTDPPYDEASVGLYGELAELAARVLKPGGWCLAYAGQSFLPDVLNAMQKHLTYGWTFAIVHAGGDLRYRKLKLQNKWKPIVGFYKPPLDTWWDWFPDMATGKREKAEHPWQQALAEAGHFIGAFAPKNGIVFDPMCGSGTIPLAARRLGRTWLAHEIDGETATKAIERINDPTV